MTLTGQKGNLVRAMFKNLTLMLLAAGLVFGPLPARAISILDSGSVQVEETGSGQEIASLDKEKPSKPEKEEKKPKEKKKYDDFKDKNGNGIDDRFEKKEPPKKKKKPEEAEVNF